LALKAAVWFLLGLFAILTAPFVSREQFTT
jgi:hypothetical protein